MNIYTLLYNVYITLYKYVLYTLYIICIIYIMHIIHMYIMLYMHIMYIHTYIINIHTILQMAMNVHITTMYYEMPCNHIMKYYSL